MNRVTITDAAELLLCSPHSVRRMIGAGQLRASKIAGRWVIESADIDDLVNRQSTKPRRRRARAAS